MKRIQLNYLIADMQRRTEKARILATHLTQKQSDEVWEKTERACKANGGEPTYDDFIQTLSITGYVS